MANIPQSNFLELDCSSPKFNNRNLTNHVLIETREVDAKKRKEIIFYCPVYMRLKIRNFSKLEIDNLSGSINLEIVFTINMKDIPSYLIEKIQEKITIRFNRDDPISFSDEESSNYMTLKPEEVDGLWTFTVRKCIASGLVASIFFSPIETIKLILTISLQDVYFNKQEIHSIIKNLDEDIPIENRNKIKSQLLNWNSLSVHFNFMDIKCPPNSNEQTVKSYLYHKISWSEEKNFGVYELAEKKLSVEYSNQDLLEQQDEKLLNEPVNDYSEINPFKYAHFKIPVYKIPISPALTIFVPVFLLSLTNICLYFTEPGLADRIASLAALMIGFVALIPVIRDSLPPNPSITLVQLLVYASVFTLILCFIESMYIEDQQDYNFVPLENGYFIVTMIIYILIFVMVTGGLLFEYLYMRGTNSFNTLETQIIDFDYQQWDNYQCDVHFRRKIDSSQIRMLRTDKREKKIPQQQ